MIQNPYAVLGISENATPEEIKKAYRKKVKQYHPDLNPGDETATQKMNEVNEAYDMLTNPEKYKRRETGNPYGQNPYGSSGNPYGQGGFAGFDFEDIFRGFARRVVVQPLASDSPAVAGAIRAINQMQYGAAVEILRAVETARRNARWYYVSAMAHYGMGHTMEAVAHMERAVSMDPNQPEYKNILEQMRYAGQSYRQSGGFSVDSNGMFKCCAGLCLARLFCPFCFCGC